VPRGAIVVGDQHACAIERGGKVACWGKAGDRLGPAGSADQPSPVEIAGLDDVAGLAASRDTTCAWTVRGEVWCWGGAERDPRAGDRRPRRVPHLHDVVQIVAGFGGACALRADGHVACFPSDAWLDPLWPGIETVAGLADAVELAGDDRHVCARSKTGAVACTLIVDGSHYLLRDQRATAIPEAAGAMSLAGSGERFAAIVDRGHRLVTWDVADLEGRRGPAPATPFVRIDGLDADRVYLGDAAAGAPSICVLGARDECFDARALESAGSEAIHARATRSPAGARDLALGRDVSCARIDDHAECWGKIGLTGDGGEEQPAAPVDVAGVADATQLEAIGDRACVLRQGGRVACWGARGASFDELGDAVIDRAPVDLPDVSDAVEIAMSYDLACARRRTGGVTCWSVDLRGGALHAARVPALDAATRLLSGVEVCGVGASGDVACTSAAVPAMHPPRLEPQLTAGVAAGRPCVEAEHRDITCFHGAGAIEIEHTQNYDQWCSLVTGRIVCHYGADTTRTFEPIEHLEHVVSWDGQYALLADGTVRTRGDVPAVRGFAGVVELRAGFRALCGRLRDGRVQCWGARDYLGAGQRGAPGTPVRVASLVMDAPRPVVPGAEPPAPLAAPRDPTIDVAGKPMLGPFADVLHVCAAVTCPRGERLDCLDAEPELDLTMPSPPAPLRDVRMISIDCRDPDYRRDDAHTFRMLVVRGDGAWLSAPLFRVGGNEKYCAPTLALQWEARDVVAGNRGAVLSVLGGTRCSGVQGGSAEAVAMIVAVSDARRPLTFPPIATASERATSCGETADCTPHEDVVQLVATFAADGRLAIAGAATWPKLARGKSGAIEGVDPRATEKSTAGTYRFVAK
jgi:hypothetical protein